MKLRRTILYIGLMLSACLTAWALDPARAQEEVFLETFDGPDLPGWELAPPCDVTDGHLHIGPGGGAHLPLAIDNAAVTVRMRRMSEEGVVAIRFRMSDAGSYIARMEGRRIAVLRERAGEMITLEESEMELPAATWVTLQMNLQGGEQVVSIAEIGLKLTIVDPDPLATGGIMFLTEGEMDAQFDDLEVRTDGAPLTEEPAHQETPQESPPEPETPAELPDFSSLTWQRMGGPPGGLGYDIRMRPYDPDVMFVTDAHAGIHKSVDGGLTWEPVNEGIDPFTGGIFTVFSATIDPHDYDTVWVGTQFTGHIYRSVDGGETWEARDDGVAREGRSVRGITIDPKDPDIVYAGLEVASAAWAGENRIKRFDLVKGEVYKSEDAGLTWRLIWVGDNLARYIWVDPRDSDRLYVSTGIFDRDAADSDVPKGDWGGVGILRSDDAGQTWAVLDERNGLGGRYVPSIFMHPEDPDTLLAAVTSTGDAPGAYVTRDGGDSWDLLWPMPSGAGAEAVEIAGADPDVWYVSGENVIWRSDDAGETWQEFAMRTSDRAAGLPIDLQVDPRDPYRIFVNNYGGGNFLSENGGESWVEASRGYTGLGVYALIVDPQDPASVMAKNYTSRDGGQTWRAVAIPEFETYAIWHAAPDSETIVIAGHEGVWAGRMGSPDWISMELVDIQAELAAGRIDDERMLIADLAVSPMNSQVLYAGFAHGNCAQGIWERCLGVPTPGFFRSVDGGTHWERIDTAPWNPFATLNIDLDPQQAGTLYVGTAVGLYRSQDAGDNWERLDGLAQATNQVPIIDRDMLPTEIDSPIVHDVHIDPFDADTLYAAATPGGVYRSDDGGSTWIQVAAGMDPNEPVYVLLVDPFRPGVLYASSEISGVFVSVNRGDAWRIMSDGLFIRNVRGLALSGDGRHLYAGSLGGGVFRMDFFGDPPRPRDHPVEEEPPQSEERVTVTETAIKPTPTQTPPSAETGGGSKLPCLGAALPLLVVGWVLLRKQPHPN
jgi:photosystem II stability/assembly factor-like uncharacterized protein